MHPLVRSMLTDMLNDARSRISCRERELKEHLNNARRVLKSKREQLALVAALEEMLVSRGDDVAAPSLLIRADGENGHA